MQAPVATGQGNSERRVPARSPGCWPLGRQAVLAGAGLLVVLLLLFDWNWLRQPLERFISARTQREFRVGHLDVDLGLNPVIKLRHVYFANAPWSKSTEPTAAIGSLEFSFSLRDVWETKKIYIPRAKLMDADLQLERAPDLKKNWVLKEPSRSAEPSRVRIGSLSVVRGRLRYVNNASPFLVDILATPVSATISPASPEPLTTRLDFKGEFRGSPYSGEAITGEVITLRDTELAFPVKGVIVSGTNRLMATGTMTDIADLSASDLDFQITGRSLKTLGSAIELPLPESPSFGLSAHLEKRADTYAITNLNGKIGASDFSGTGEYRQDGTRPSLRASLASKHLHLSELWDRASGKGGSTPPTRQAQGIPFGTIDAEVRYAAAKLHVSRNLPTEDVRLTYKSSDAVATLAPLDVGFAGGRIVSAIQVDRRDKSKVRSFFNADFRRIQLAQLLPKATEHRKAVGQLGGQVRLSGIGDSMSAFANSASGTITAALPSGRISSAMDAAAGLNGGKFLSLIAGGDKGVAVNCAGAYFTVKHGVGHSRLLVLDTEQTRVDGAGMFDLNDEKFALVLEPKPKRPGILSMRSRIRAQGTFDQPSFSFDKGQLALRAGGAIALALVNPIAALLPLIETGQGVDADCKKVLASVQGAQMQAVANGSAPPAGPQ
jgi:AsmA family protein